MLPRPAPRTQEPRRPLLAAPLSPRGVRASQVLIEEAGGRFLRRPPHAAGKVDALSGAPSLGGEIAARVGF